MSGFVVLTNTKVTLFKYQPHSNGLVRKQHLMRRDATEIARYLSKGSQAKLFSKIRRALVFSVLFKTMKTFNELYRPTDIIASALTLNFVCSIMHSSVIWNFKSGHRYHLGYILHSISRQSVLVISDTIAHNVHLRDVGTSSENTLLLMISTTIFIAALTVVPSSFLHDDQQGSLKDLLMYSFTSRYAQLHIPGLAGNTSLGVMLYGLLFSIFSMLDNNEQKKSSEFVQTLHQAIALIFSHLFLSQIVPSTTTQVIPIALLLGMYIVSEKLPMSNSVSSFVMWKTAGEVANWTTRAVSGASIDQLLVFSLAMCIFPILDSKIASVLAVSALQIVVSVVMNTLKQFGHLESITSSVCLLLISDIFLDVTY